MSRVFVAEELALGRRVVVKVLAPELAESVSAERVARRVQRWTITNSPEEYIPYATYLREQGRLGGLVGDREWAIAAYRRYLRLRARHEPALDRDLATVRAELDKLERQSSGR